MELYIIQDLAKSRTPAKFISMISKIDFFFIYQLRTFIDDLSQKYATALGIKLKQQQ